MEFTQQQIKQIEKERKERYKKMAEDRAKFEARKKEVEEEAKGLIIKPELWQKNSK